LPPRTLNRIYQRAYNAANYGLRSFAGGHFASACRPTSIALLLTERCHARCLHCDIWQNKGREDNPTPAEWKGFLAELSDWLGPVQVTFTGGEALLRPEAPELVEYAVSRGLFVELLTNGFWTDHSRLLRAARTDPWQITMSLDGVGDVHSLVRGRANFWAVASQSLEILSHLRKAENLHYRLLLKTVIMQQNLESLPELAAYAERIGAQIFYQPVEQNYNAAPDPFWYRTSPNWPRDIPRAVAQVRELARLKQNGAPIVNSSAQFEVMAAYFQSPAGLHGRVQAHGAHETKHSCAALTSLQVQANGDVRVCARKPVIGNIRTQPIRQIWANRPHHWESGCCLGC
jgi:MoaA/NifB/PqqE/SkfB family radical SAM enzyme